MWHEGTSVPNGLEKIHDVIVETNPDVVRWLKTRLEQLRLEGRGGETSHIQTGGTQQQTPLVGRGENKDKKKSQLVMMKNLLVGLPHAVRIVC